MVVDLHGTYLHELSKKLDNIILKALTDDDDIVELITGIGPLQNKVIELCKKLYNYDPHIKLNNPGVVVVCIKD